METLNAIVNILILIMLPFLFFMTMLSYGNFRYSKGKLDGFKELAEMSKEALELAESTMERQKKDLEGQHKALKRADEALKSAEELIKKQKSDLEEVKKTQLSGEEEELIKE